jgi:hypothetical protein
MNRTIQQSWTPRFPVVELNATSLGIESLRASAVGRETNFVGQDKVSAS